MIKKDGNKTLFFHNGTEYELSDHPYEPCMYIKKDGETVVTLHNAFTVSDLPELFSGGGTVTAIDGKTYGEEDFCRVLDAAVESGRSEMDFTFAAVLADKNGGL